ncbi:hypothetical protein CMI37_12795 [Candidatus Pacearchaeota archaeon]|nr:hypothetical protein [Candidatus Pacearchaeota archaeon]
MPKKVFTLKDFSGGLVTDTSPRALEDNELAVCKNLDPTSKGKVTCSRVFKQADANYTDQPEAGTGNAVAITTGYGLFAFANDYTLANPPVAGYLGEFIVKADGGSAGANFIDILEPAGTWLESLISAQATTPCFYAAEGDLFCGGDHTSAPRSLTYHAQSQIPSASVTPVNDWIDATQEKVKPDASTDGKAQKIYQATTDNSGTITGIGKDDALNWIIKPSATASSGLWTNTNTASTTSYEFAATWLYKGFDPIFGVNCTESEMFGVEDDATWGGSQIPQEGSYTDVSIQVQCWYSEGTPITTASQDKYGARLYSRYGGDGDSEWYLLAEMDMEKGMRGAGSTEWNAWEAAADEFDHANTGDTCTTGDISAPPALITFKIANGYSVGDIPTSGLVYFKTGLVANSRAYVGNVKINGRTYGDRILKSPIFKYDVFTEDNYLDVAINDGDQITALAAHADRILQFKNSAVYIINVSKELEFLEDEQQGAGVGWQAAVTTTPFGVIWVNQNACYLYDGDKITQLQLGKISSSNWSDNIDSVTPKSIVGYDTIKQQLIVLWDATSSGSGEAYIFDAETGSWYETDDILVHAVNCTNMVNARGDKLIIGGNAAVDDINFLEDRTSAPAIDFRTKVLDLGNAESRKNLLEVAAVYKYGKSNQAFSVSTDDGKTFTALGYLSDTDADIVVTEFDTSATAALQGKKTFQIKIDGYAISGFELSSISLTYRDLGVH